MSTRRKRERLLGDVEKRLKFEAEMLRRVRGAYVGLGAKWSHGGWRGGRSDPKVLIR